MLDPKLKRRVIKEGLRPTWHDNCQSWEMDSTGKYGVSQTRRVRACAQEALLALMADED